MKKHIRECADLLEENGFDILSLDFSRKHPRIAFRYGDQEAFIFVAGTPRQPTQEAVRAVQRARKAVGIKGEEGVTVRRRHRRTAAEAEVRAPLLIADTRTDYRDALAKHPHFPTVLRQRADRAFSNFWRDICLELFGVPRITLDMGRN